MSLKRWVGGQRYYLQRFRFAQTCDHCGTLEAIKRMACFSEACACVFTRRARLPRKQSTVGFLILLKMVDLLFRVGGVAGCLPSRLPPHFVAANFSLHVWCLPVEGRRVADSSPFMSPLIWLFAWIRVLSVGVLVVRAVLCGVCMYWGPLTVRNSITDGRAKFRMDMGFYIGIPYVCMPHPDSLSSWRRPPTQCRGLPSWHLYDV